MKQITKLLSLLTLTLATASFCSAALTEASIQKWIEAYPAVDAWMQDNEDIMDAIVDEEAMAGMSIEEMMQAGFDAIKSHPIYHEFQALVKPLGYKDADTLIADTIQIFKTYGAISMKREMAEEGGFDLAQLKQQITEIDQMMGLNAQQKQMMKQQLEAVMSQMGSMMESFESVSEADIELLTPFYDKIASIMGESEEMDAEATEEPWE